MDWNNLSLVILGLVAFFSAFTVALWISLVIWTFRDMRARTRDAFAQLLAAAMVAVLGPFGVILYLMLRPRETLAEKYERSLEEEALLQDIEERMICPACKQPIENDYRLCPVCHTRLRQPCVHCERLIHPRWSLCPYCGQSQAPIPGANRVGRVTLLDLEQETTPPVAPPAQAAETPELVIAESAQAIASPAHEPPEQKAAVDAEYVAPLEPEWEELDIEALDPEAEDESLSVADELADLDAPEEAEEPESPSQGKNKARDLLSSLFKRS